MKLPEYPVEVVFDKMNKIDNKVAEWINKPQNPQLFLKQKYDRIVSFLTPKSEKINLILPIIGLGFSSIYLSGYTCGMFYKLYRNIVGLNQCCNIIRTTMLYTPALIFMTFMSTLTVAFALDSWVDYQRFKGNISIFDLRKYPKSDTLEQTRQP